jgi:peroxiredoxin Q/BCP
VIVAEPEDAQDADGTTEGGSMVEEGQLAPEFELKSDTGETVRLSDLRGRRVVLYFYPKDDTPGCTRQACDLRDSWGEYEQLGAVVLGISPDDEESHAAFKAKYSLPFTLLADPGHAVADAYGVWGEFEIPGGEKLLGVVRSTFVVDEDGVVRRVMHKVDPATHAQDVLADLRPQAATTS